MDGLPTINLPERELYFELLTFWCDACASPEQSAGSARETGIINSYGDE